MALNIRLPLPGTPARELLGDISEVANMLAPENRDKLPVVHMALSSAREHFMKDPALREIYQITRNLDGDEFYFLRLTNDGVDSNGGGCVSISHVWDFC